MSNVIKLNTKYIIALNKNMIEENMHQECRLKNKIESKNYLNEEINQNNFMSKKHKKVCFFVLKEHPMCFCTLFVIEIYDIDSIFYST